MLIYENDIFKRFQIQDFIQQKLLKKDTDTILVLIY